MFERFNKWRETRRIAREEARVLHVTKRQFHIKATVRAQVRECGDVDYKPVAAYLMENGYGQRKVICDLWEMSELAVVRAWKDGLSMADMATMKSPKAAFVPA